MKKILLSIILLLCSFYCVSQKLTFTTIKSASGKIDKTYPVYAYGPYKPNNSIVCINLTDSVITAGNDSYEVIERPKRWIVKRYYRYVNIYCTDKYCHKVIVRYFLFDNGGIKITIMDENQSTRYIVTR